MPSLKRTGALLALAIVSCGSLAWTQDSCASIKAQRDKARAALEKVQAERLPVPHELLPIDENRRHV